MWGSLTELANPDIAKMHGLVVILQEQWHLFGMRLVGRALHVVGWSGQFGVVLHKHAILQNSDVSGMKQLAVGSEARSVEDDVVSLPFAGAQAGIHQWRCLRVNGTGLAIGVSLVLVRIENLELVTAHEIDAAVASALILVVRRVRLGPFDVQLTIAERLRGTDVAGSGNNFDGAVDNFPARGATFVVLPLGEISAIEEYDGVRGSLSRGLLGAGRGGGDDGRRGTVAIGNFPAGEAVVLGVLAGSPNKAAKRKQQRIIGKCRMGNQRTCSARRSPIACDLSGPISK